MHDFLLDFNFDYSKELDAIKSIQAKSMEKILNLTNLIEHSDSLQTCSKTIPKCNRNERKNFMKKEEKFLAQVEKQNVEYKTLIEQKKNIEQLKQKIDTNTSNLLIQLDELKEKKNSLKHSYKMEKAALNMAEDLYKKSFGLKLSVGRCDDYYKTSVLFNEQSKKIVTFTICSKTNTILDFAVNWLSEEDKLHELKIKYKESKNVFALICSLRQLAISDEVN